MIRGTSTQDAPASYADLLAHFVPASITTNEEAHRVQRQIDDLIDRGMLSPDERKFLSLLDDLMLAWEGDRYDLPMVAPVDAIRALLDARGMRQGDLVGRVFPTKGIASEVLSGKRRLTYEHVARLAEVFHVSPAVFYLTPSSGRQARIDQEILDYAQAMAGTPDDLDPALEAASLDMLEREV